MQINISIEKKKQKTTWCTHIVSISISSRSNSNRATKAVGSWHFDNAVCAMANRMAIISSGRQTRLEAAASRAEADLPRSRRFLHDDVRIADLDDGAAETAPAATTSVGAAHWLWQLGHELFLLVGLGRQ